MQKKLAFTLVELLVVIAIIGMLVSLLLPAVNSAREAARRTQCINNMRQVSLAIANHESSLKIYPPARFEARPGEFGSYCGGLQPSWVVRVLPYLEESALADQWDVKGEFTVHDEALRKTHIRALLCTTRRGPLVADTRSYVSEPAPCGCGGEIQVPGGALGDYAAVHGDPTPEANGGEQNFSWGGYGTGIMISARAECDISNWTIKGIADKVRIKDIRDGLGKTLLFGEKHIQRQGLGLFPYDSTMYDGDKFQAFARIGGPGYPIASGPNDEATDFLSFGGWHEGGCNFAVADGSVRTINSWLDTTILANLCNRHDGQVVSFED